MAGVPVDKFNILADKWERVIHGDLLADELNEGLQVNKALHAFQELSNQKLTESSYCAQVALLNAALIHQFEGACFNVGPKRFQENFAKFDQLIVLSDSLPKTPTLKEFQRYAKSCYYYRIGDYLLLSMKPVPDPFDKNQFLAALCAYSIALCHQFNEFDPQETYAPHEAFNILELRVLLAQNQIIVGGTSAVYESFRGNKLISYINSLLYAQKENAGAFVKADLPKHIKLVELQKIDSRKLMTQVWQVRRHGAFLKRFLWIRARLPLADDCFLDNLVTRFNEFPQAFSSVYEVQDFSLFDMKFLIYRMSSYAETLEIKPKTQGKSFLYPSHFQPVSNKQFLRIWSIVNTLLDNGTYKRDKTSDRITFVSMLEETRQNVYYESEKTNLTKAANYILDTIIRRADLPSNTRQLLSELFERYTKAVLSVKYSGQPSTFFPPYGDQTTWDYRVIKDTIYYLLAQHALHFSDFAKANSYVEQISEDGKTKEGVMSLIEKIRQRDSKSASPTSIDDFQIVDESQIVDEPEIVDKPQIVDETQTVEKTKVSDETQTEPIYDDTNLDDTFRTCDGSSSKLLEHSKVLELLLDSFMEMSIEQTKKIQTGR